MSDINNKIVRIATYVNQATHRRLAILAAETGLDKKVLYRLALDYASLAQHTIEFFNTSGEFVETYKDHRENSGIDYPPEPLEEVDEIPF